MTSPARTTILLRVTEFPRQGVGDLELTQNYLAQLRVAPRRPLLTHSSTGSHSKATYLQTLLDAAHRANCFV